MTQDTITYAAIAASVSDMATDWTSLLPDITLQNTMYLFTILWIGVQLWFKLKGK